MLAALALALPFAGQCQAARKDEGLLAARLAHAGLEMKSTYSAAVHLLLNEALGPEAGRAAAEEWLAAHFDVTRNRHATGAWTPFWHYAYLWPSSAGAGLRCGPPPDER